MDKVDDATGRIVYNINNYSLEIKDTTLEENNVNIKVLVGKILGYSSSISTYSPVSIFDTQFKQPNELNLSIPTEQRAMIYIIEGELNLLNTGKTATKGQMIYFDQSVETLCLHSISKQGSYLVLAGKPLNENVARYGPFVANNEDELQQAIQDYQTGKMGQL